MKFIDEAVIIVRAGHGGAGNKSFRREKFVPMGGPDGGNGGAGGSVIIKADENMQTLLDFHYKKKLEAPDGKRGGTSNKDGLKGDDMLVRLPIGTQIFNADNNELICDLTSQGQEIVLAQGGRGGKGNSFFRTATHQAPEYFQPGEEGQSGTYRLSLKLVADVGIIGFPNAGKSTLISRISAAKPKIADYPFTTLVPNLGVVRAKGGKSFVVADIPGLIPGAHLGKGLGIKFLKHVERTRVLVHLIDVLQPGGQDDLSPIEAFNLINKELEQFSNELAGRQQIVALSKCETLSDKKTTKKIIASFKKTGFKCLAISSVTGAGIDELVEEISSALNTPKKKVTRRKKVG